MGPEDRHTLPKGVFTQPVGPEDRHTLPKGVFTDRWVKRTVIRYPRGYLQTGGDAHKNFYDMERPSNPSRQGAAWIRWGLTLMATPSWTC